MKLIKIIPMKKLKSSLIVLFLAASQWATAQSGSNCPDAIPQNVQATSLAAFDTLSFDGVGNELWLEFQAPSDGSGVVIDYRKKPGSGGTDVIAIEVYQQNGSCANLQLITSKSLAIDSTVLVELDSTVGNSFYSIKLVKNSGDVRNNDIIGAVTKSLKFGICWQNMTQGTSGYCFQYQANGDPTETTYYDQWGNPFEYQSCIINACVGDVLCYSGFSYDPVTPSANCPNYPFQLDNW